MIFVSGGARSGKSRFAETLAARYDSVCYIATAIAFDAEMQRRIRIHQARRPENWETVEGFLQLPALIEKKRREVSCILFDCLTLWTTNYLFHLAGEETLQKKEQFVALEKEILEEMARIVKAAGRFPEVIQAGAEVIFVTNELGMGVVPESLLGREFRDIAGAVNQMAAAAADEAYFLVSGIPMRLK